MSNMVQKQSNNPTNNSMTIYINHHSQITQWQTKQQFNQQFNQEFNLLKLSQHTKDINQNIYMNNYQKNISPLCSKIISVK